MEWWLAYLAMGLAVGFFAGMLGIGGGVLLVPLMVFAFSAQHFPLDRVVHLALGTALTSIVFTSLSSLRAHHRHGAVRWEIVRVASPGLVAGTLLGTFIADWLDSRYLAIFFVVFVYYSAARLFSSRKPEATRRLPGAAGLSAGAAGVGAISSLVGAGGGVVSIPLMIMCNVPVRHAVGTSAALGLPIALAGAAGYIFNGLDQTHLPAFSVGYVYLPALAGLVIGTFITVPMGARAAHTMPVERLKKIFAVILFLLATQMLW